MNFLKPKVAYKEQAKVQEFMANKLCLKLLNLKRNYFRRVFEFGCARAELSQKLEKIISFDEYIKNDILDYGVDFKVEIFDMNEIASHPLSEQKFDLIISNATLQWLDLKHILPILSKMLDEKGILLLSTFGERNLEQITQSTGFSLKYYSVLELEQIFKQYFLNVEIKEEFKTLEFKTPLEVFKHLKLSGVNSLGYYFLGKDFLKEFEQKFHNCLTYHPIFILCKKYIK
ncbi:methyltransferase domain-containing protein [Campylobacter sp. TTU-622]|uniref:methyltransferase domain-containing protein n=1 Tax=Campylobacter sp. TTU-622 TaxID=2800583 RepID=UPI0019039D7D|nr:methyltransferase domain-containing protein [Campylobacter sp. TTU-622]MBK1972746.1 methyltransferase domain-containing protein [Campylobacter sp. TTU-622]